MHLISVKSFQISINAIAILARLALTKRRNKSCHLKRDF